VYAWGQGTNGQLGVVGPEYKSKNELSMAANISKSDEKSSTNAEASIPRREAPDYPYFLTTPTKIDFFDDKKVKMIACGDTHSMAVLETGELYHWGGVQGLYTDGDIDVLTTPTLAKKISPVISKVNVISLSGGATHNLFVVVPKEDSNPPNTAASSGTTSLESTKSTVPLVGTMSSNTTTTATPPKDEMNTKGDTEPEKSTGGRRKK